MILMKFDKAQEIGIRQIDIQHKAIIDNVNHIYKIKDKEKSEVVESFNALVEKLKEHFEHEEKLMKENKVVNFISHKLEHDRALSKYSNYFNTFKSSMGKFDPEILFSLKSWLENHLEKKDKKLQEIAISN